MNAGAMAVGKKVFPVRRLCVCAGSELMTEAGMSEPTGLYPRKAAKSAAVGGRPLKELASCGTPALVTAAVRAGARLAPSATNTIEKKTAVLAVIPVFWTVARIPDAAPLVSGGTEFIIATVLGLAKRPPPSPMTKIITANCQNMKS